MRRHRTAGSSGYAVEFSPFFENKLAVAGGANFGIVGNGRVTVLNLHEAGMQEERIYETQDGAFDLAWSEIHENQLVSSHGDGSVKLWDLTAPDFPIMNWAEHTKEVYSVHWNQVKRDAFITGSWDQSIRIWSPDRPTALATYQEHTYCIYSVIWSPHHTELFASASGDHSVKLWDTRAPTSTHTFRAHNNEVLSVDWNKYQPGVLVTGSVDTTLKGWDTRNLNQCLFHLSGHELAVRRVKCSPHSPRFIASASYDMTLRLWDTHTQRCIDVFGDHTEFVAGLDFNLYMQGVVATAAWDESVCVLSMPSLLKPL